MIKRPDISILDLAPIREGDSAAGAFRNSLDLARHAEGWGYKRFWLAEHHSIPGIASAATAVVIGHIAGGTSRIRVGAGGIMLPLPFAFASHFAPDYLSAALALYRDNFKPSESLDRPRVMIGVNAFAADTDYEARRLFTSLQQAFVALVRGRLGLLQPPVDSMEGRWSPAERAHIDRMTRISVVGSAATVRRGLEILIDATDADELMLTGQIFDHAARLRSFEVVSQVHETMDSDRIPAGGDHAA
jgi:alkanesulfonate monooxygenase SsuD/methylene tetrahydromethanopterin reductase-like flavin-dependent oxidoreductase (luciferase family)